MDESLKKYVHQTWDDRAKCRNEKYYFVQISEDIEKQFAEMEYQLEIGIPEELKVFYRTVGYGFLWFSLPQKKGLYRILSPEEILDLYFEPEHDETRDDFITYRENAWEKLEGSRLLAFSLFGEEDSLLYMGITDGAIYYLSSARKIANSFVEFLNLLDKEVDYFIK